MLFLNLASRIDSKNYETYDSTTCSNVFDHGAIFYTDGRQRKKSEILNRFESDGPESLSYPIVRPSRLSLAEFAFNDNLLLHFLYFFRLFDLRLIRYRGRDLSDFHPRPLRRTSGHFAQPARGHPRNCCVHPPEAC